MNKIQVYEIFSSLLCVFHAHFTSQSNFCVCSNHWEPSSPFPFHAPTVLFVKMDVGLVLLSALQRLLYLLGHVLAGVVPVQEVARAVLLHHLGSGEAGQLTEAVGAVNDGVAAVPLGIAQQEVTVCEEDRRC